MKKILSYVFAAFLAFSMMYPTSATDVQAASTYDVVFKAGSHGTFTEEPAGATLSEDKKTLTYEVGVNEEFPEVPEIKIDEGYRTNGWNETPAVGTNVQERQVYVAKYTKLVNAVEFTVKYVDNFGNQLATPRIYTTELGSTQTVFYKDIEGYVVDAYQKTMEVTRDGIEIEFRYTSEAEMAEPPVQEQIVYVEGEPVYVTGDGEGNPVTTTPAGDATTGDDDTTGDTGGGTGDDQGTGEENVDDPDTPQAGDNNEENVDDPDTPQAGDNENKADNNALYIAGGVGIVALIALIAYLLSKKKKQSDAE